MKVIIIGAGVAGLALAQILRKKNIAFEIYERDDGSRGQGWSVGLDDCLADLKALLPDDLQPLAFSSPNQAIGKSDSFAFLNAQSHQVLGLISPGDNGRDFISADRNELRKILMQGLKVQYGKYMRRFEEDASGVTVHFEDDSSTHGTILVGADGSRSSVRAQLLKGFEAVPSRCIMLQGAVRLSKEEYQPMLDLANTSVMLGEPYLKTYLMLTRFENDGSATWHWGVATLYSVNEAPEKRAWAQKASAEELHESVLKRTSHFPAYFQHAIRATGPEGMYTPPITLMETVLPEDQLPDGSVTLLGDAAHSMVPFRGMGANTALRDACDLGIALGNFSEQREACNLQEVLRTYERSIIPRGRSHVMESRADAEADDHFDLSGGRIDFAKS